MNWPQAMVLVALIAAAVALIVTGNGWWVAGPVVFIVWLLVF